jgi:hypothetical protein
MDGGGGVWSGSAHVEEGEDRRGPDGCYGRPDSGGRLPVMWNMGRERRRRRERGGEADGWDRLRVGPAGREARERALTCGPAGFK